MILRVVILSIFLLFTTPTHSVAQSLFEYGDQTLAIDLQPAFPGPEEQFLASINDYSLPVSAVGFQWYVDGKAISQEDNQRQLSLQTKGVGGKTEIKVVVTLSTGRTIETIRTIEPVYLDIIVEPQTRTPAFYKGRALPSIGSMVNVTALVNANNIPPKDLVYTWRVNNKVLEGGSVRARNNISFAMPQGPSALVGLEVRRPNGEVVASRLFEVSNFYPSLSFYEKHTLYGIKERAIQGQLTLVGESVSIRAEPYYLDVRMHGSPDHIEWQVGGDTLVNTSKNPYEITLSSQGQGSALVEFHVRDLEQLLQGAESTFRVTF